MPDVQTPPHITSSTPMTLFYSYVATITIKSDTIKARKITQSATLMMSMELK